MNKDRGTIKWNAMMLPEYVQQLREWKAEDKRIEKPDVDEWALQQISEQIEKAYTYRLMIELTIWHEIKLEKVADFIEKINLQKQNLTLKNGRTIKLSSICDATIFE